MSGLQCFWGRERPVQECSRISAAQYADLWEMLGLGVIDMKIKEMNKTAK